MFLIKEMLLSVLAISLLVGVCASADSSGIKTGRDVDPPQSYFDKQKRALREQLKT